MSNFIVESAIYQEAAVVKTDAKKAIFRMTMQTADETNQNKRKYPFNVLDEGMSNCRERMEKYVVIRILEVVKQL